MSLQCAFNMFLYLENVKLTRKNKPQNYTITIDPVWSHQNILIYQYLHLEQDNNLLWGQSKMSCLSYYQRKCHR